MLHDRENRGQANDFAFLQVSESKRNAFITRMNGIVGSEGVALTYAVIRKDELERRYNMPWGPYALALTFCMETPARHLKKHGERETAINVVFEARGAREDRQLEIELRCIASGQGRLGNMAPEMTRFTWQLIFAKKSSNSAGLQIADFAAGPPGLSALRRDQSNRVVDAGRPKLLFPHSRVFSREKLRATEIPQQPIADRKTPAHLSWKTVRSGVNIK